MEEDPNALRPVDVKKRPAPGQLVYVPDRPGLSMLHGGHARVSESSTRRTLYVDEDPGWQYTWHELQHRQLELWAQFGTRRARMATHEELQAAKAAREAQEAVQRAQTEEVRKLAAEAERLQWEPKSYLVLNRGMMAVPAWCQHRRAKNWAAILKADPSLPGGFEREWFSYARGSAFYFIPPRLQVGDAVEFAADYVQGTGRVEPDRWYGVVTALAPDFVQLQKCQDAAHAAVRSAQMKAANESVVSLMTPCANTG